MRSDRFRAAVAAIDAANADDPNVIVVDGTTVPKELAHAERMTAWVERLDPEASEAQLLAARAHHVRRWTLPRSDYPDGRSGYLRWRAAAKRRHADEVARILDECGYDLATIERVQQIIRKEGLRDDPEVQTHEDALCLVFLETQLHDLVTKLADEAKAQDVLRKTMTKMSPRARDAARALALPDGDRSLVVRALQEVDS